jgi:hypothetical protein
MTATTTAADISEARNDNLPLFFYGNSENDPDKLHRLQNTRILCADDIAERAEITAACAELRALLLLRRL